jgi:hypothetical protein
MTREEAIAICATLAKKIKDRRRKYGIYEMEKELKRLVKEYNILYRDIWEYREKEKRRNNKNDNL